MVYQRRYRASINECHLERVGPHSEYVGFHVHDWVTSNSVSGTVDLDQPAIQALLAVVTSNAIYAYPSGVVATGWLSPVQ